MGTTTVVFVTLDGRRLEYEEVPGAPAAGAPLVFLHEGVGSVGLWRGFPHRVAEATGRRTLTYSRHGHGGSDAPARPRTPSFMHEEAREVLPRLLEAWGVEAPLLVGHSDGGSIALIHAAEHPVTAVACLAPHVFVEQLCLDEIVRIKAAFEREGLRERMARHHRDPEAAFYGWNDVWLDPAFRDWSIVDLLSAIDAPVLVVQGSNDPYGTMAHADAVAASAAGPVERVVLRCGHHPHLQAEEETFAAVTRFADAHRLRTTAPAP
ncbi:MAG TPA: alpha/beta hydrolase [Solirubrobacteraceae bacterium]|jgi:pimeloyl-ACP methyl ester carboxylesterase|nr:alpha/beta hydrolase [Solirubrobacteraceae bacterium]